MSLAIKKRCIVLVGKSGAGKSTIANLFIGHDPLSDKDPPFTVSSPSAGLKSETSEVTHEIFEFTKGDVKYMVTVIDTIGLFDSELSNDVVLDQLADYFKDRINGIHVIFFVFKKGRFTTEEENVFSLLREKFKKEISPISALAVTGCENDTPEIRREFIQNFEDDKKTKEIAGQMEKGIFPVGFPPVKTMAKVFQDAYKEGMARDRETLMELVIRSDRNVLTRELFEQEVLPKARGGCTIL